MSTVTNLRSSCLTAPEPVPRLKTKRAAMVTFSRYPGDPRPRRVVDALLKEGLAIDLVCIGYKDTKSRETLNGIDILRLPIVHRRDSKFAYIWNYARFIFISACILAFRSLKRRYDLVYIHNMPDVLVISSLIPKLLGAKVVLDLHDPMPELMTTIFKLDEGCLAVRVVRWLERWSIACAHSVLTVNDACKRAFASRSCSSDKIRVVMNAPDEQIIPFHPARSNAPSRDPRAKPFTIMYHGTLVERNGLHVAVDALAQVRKKIPNAELKIYATETPYSQQTMAKVRSIGLENCVHFLGPKRLEEIVREIEECDLGVVPNQRNAFTEINTPTRIFEYLSLGKPVIAPRTLGVQDYFSPDSLFFFEPGDAEELAREIEYVAFHYADALKKVERGQRVLLKHTWSQESRILVDAVDELLNGARP